MSQIDRHSLNALRAFAVAAKHLNLAAAASELFVTPSALSHQIRALEASLGMPLFERLPRGLKLTAAGEKLLPGVSAGFERIESALAQLRRPAEGVLTVSMLSTFAMRWFIPRLTRFQQQHPGIDVRMATSSSPADFEREAIDCAIHFGHGDWPNLAADELFGEQLAPFCAPRLVADHPLEQPQELLKFRLLSARMRPDDWRLWLTSVGLGDLEPPAAIEFDTRNFAIAAACEGLGVVIVDPSLVAAEVGAGRLQQLFAQTSSRHGAYWFVCPIANRDAPAIAALRQWLLAEAAANRPQEEPMA